MKNILVFTLILFLCSSAISQVQIEQEDIPMEPGTAFTYLVIEANQDGIEVDLGGNGANQEWDFVDFNFEDTQTDSLLDPENAPDIEDFPDANRVLQTANALVGLGINEVLQYEVVSDSGWFMIGTVAVADDENPIPGIPFDFTNNPLIIAPLPLEFEDEWDLSVGLRNAIVPLEEWGEEIALLDSIVISVEIGGFSEVDAWGTVRFSGGEVEALRQHTRAGGQFSIIGVTEFMGRRIEVPVFDYEMEASHSYRWISPEIGEILTITSMPGEQEADFNLAGSIRIRNIVPALEFPDDALNFGIVHLGNAGAANLIIQNEGEGMGVISDVDLSENIQDEIEVLTELPVLIDPDSVGTIRFLWSPDEEKSLEEEVIFIHHNDREFENPLAIRLSGFTPDYNSVSESGFTPNQQMLSDVYPNPFNSEATVSFILPKSQSVKLDLININGAIELELGHQIYTSGSHSLYLQANTLPGGVYFLRLISNNEHQYRKVILLR